MTTIEVNAQAVSMAGSQVSVPIDENAIVVLGPPHGEIFAYVASSEGRRGRNRQTLFEGKVFGDARGVYQIVRPASPGKSETIVQVSYGYRPAPLVARRNEPAWEQFRDARSRPSRKRKR